MVWAGVRWRWSRALGLVLVIAFATGAFVVLTGSASTSRLEVRGTVDRNFRTSYDVLVRPRGARSALEQRSGLIRANFLSGQFGGITLAQWHRIQGLDGVSVAAPIAMLGYLDRSSTLTLPVPGDRAGAAALYSASVDRVTDGGTTRIPRVSSGYSYVTDAAVQAPGPPPSDPDTPYGVSVVQGGDRARVVCPLLVGSNGAPDSVGAFSPVVRQTPTCWSRGSGPNGSDRSPLAAGQVGVRYERAFTFLVAAVDPAAEQALTGLGSSVSAGSYLPAGMLPPLPTDPGGSPIAPAIIVDRYGARDTDQVTVRRLPAAAAARVGDGLSVTGVQQVLADSTGPVVAQESVSSAQAYQQFLGTALFQSGLFITSLWTAGPVSYTRDAAGVLHPRTVTAQDGVWANPAYSGGFITAPSSARDTWFRPLTAHSANAQAADGGGAVVSTIGSFSPDRLATGANALNRVPLETYDVPALMPASAASTAALGGQSLPPNDNPAGYLQSPPLMLTNLASIPRFTGSQQWVGGDDTAPISSVRVRVAGVTGADPVSRERVRLVADAITRTTGLDVDITAGSSPSRQLVELPAGRYGRPALVLGEDWVRKGVAVAVLTAIDRKSLVLFGLVLVVSAAFVANAAAAAVRSRRGEFAVLSALGWDRRALFRLVTLELAGLGLAAGVAGGASSLAVGALAGLAVSPGRAALAVPVAVALALAAGVVPALRGSRAHPAHALRPAVAAPRRARVLRSIPALAVAAARRVPGRTALAALALAVGVAAATLTLAVTVAFRGAVVGSVLGQAVTVQVRGVDIVAVAITVLLSCAAVADVIHVGIRERATEFAVLQAAGWGTGPVLRLVLGEALVVAVLGSATGGAVGLAAAAGFTGQLPGTVIAATAAVVVGGTLLTVAFALAPARRLFTLPTARLLSGE